MTVVHLQVLGDCVIEVNGTRVDPSSPHLFALLLILALENERRIPRAELHHLLFTKDVGSQQASHNLRQLLYRARRLGAMLDETALGIRLAPDCVSSIADHLSTLLSGDCEKVSPASVAFLPSYFPRLPTPFLEWVDNQRDFTSNMIRSTLRSTAAKLRASNTWAAAYRVGSALASLDPLNEDAVATMAESLAMLGRRSDALAVLDNFAGATKPPTQPIVPLRPLRARIAHLGDVKAVGALRGRASVLANLDGEWKKIGPDGARRVAIIGNAGIGKTRIGEAFAARVSLLGGHVTRYSCDASSAEQPLALFAEILPELRKLRGSIGASPELSSALDRLRPVGNSERLVSSDIAVDAVRAEVQRAIIDLLEAVSEERPLLLFVDDAHYLDAGSATVIRALCGKENSARVLVLICARPSQAAISTMEPARRSASFILDPLPPEDSRQVVIDVAGDEITESRMQWCLAQAAGNPFYLHTLASQRFVDTELVPFDIRALAINAYSSLNSSTRTVLESSLFLGRLATVSRVTKVSGVTELELLSAVRDLSALDLIQYSDGIMTGPHALLHDALTLLVPSAVAALLHSRIARVLEEECEAQQYVFPVAWAAAQSWLAAGDPHSAARLVRTCARQAALIGETQVAIELVSRVVDTTLPTALHAELLDELIEYAEASASPAIILSALRARLKLANALSDQLPRIRELERRIVEADVMTGGDMSTAISSLSGFLADTCATPYTRAQAATRLLTIADQDFDTALAERAFAFLSSISRDERETRIVCHRAEIVFHTFCGDPHTARDLALDLISQFPEPGFTQESLRSRSFAAYALLRLRDPDAEAIFQATYYCMERHGIYKEALYAASGLIANSICFGDFTLAKEWLTKSKLTLRGEVSHKLSPQSGLYGDEALLAIWEGRYDDAEPLIFAPAKHFTLLTTARHRAVSLAMWIRLKQLRGDPVDYDSEITQLTELYARGKALGGQDLVVEALWSAFVLAGDANAASWLLADYLTSRRETGKPEWSLVHTTAADEAWLNEHEH